MSARSVVMYGDFNCPWSYLASRRAGLLAASGVLRMDWRAVEHDPAPLGRHRISSGRFDALRAEMDRVSRTLLPGEAFPYSLAGFVPHTRAAISGYAEAYGAGVSSSARRLLFDAFWMGALDLNDAKVVRTLLVDAIRAGHSTSEPLREWGYSVDVTGGPITSTAWRLLGSWTNGWLGTGKEIVPVLLVDGGEPIFGEAAVDWLGEELVRWEVDVDTGSERMVPGPWVGVDVPDLSWVSQHGGRWLRTYQDAHRVRSWTQAG